MPLAGPNGASTRAAPTYLYPYGVPGGSCLTLWLWLLSAGITFPQLLAAEMFPSLLLTPLPGQNGAGMPLEVPSVC